MVNKVYYLILISNKKSFEYNIFNERLNELKINLKNWFVWIIDGIVINVINLFFIVIFNILFYLLKMNTTTAVPTQTTVPPHVVFNNQSKEVSKAIEILAQLHAKFPNLTIPEYIRDSWIKLINDIPVVSSSTVSKTKTIESKQCPSETSVANGNVSTKPAKGSIYVANKHSESQQVVQNSVQTETGKPVGYQKRVKFNDNSSDPSKGHKNFNKFHQKQVRNVSERRDNDQLRVRPNDSQNHDIKNEAEVINEPAQTVSENPDAQF